MADQAINALSTKTAPETSDQLLLVDAGEPQLIDYDKLADAILNKITSKNYDLDAGQMTLLAALNKLNSDSNKRFGTAGTTFNTISDIPEKGSCFGVNVKRLDLNETFSIPEYSRCIFINYGSSVDGAILAIASNGDLYIAFRNSRKWVNGRKL